MMHLICKDGCEDNPEENEPDNDLDFTETEPSDCDDEGDDLSEVG